MMTDQEKIEELEDAFRTMGEENTRNIQSLFKSHREEIGELTTKFNKELDKVVLENQKLKATIRR